MIPTPAIAPDPRGRLVRRALGRASTLALLTLAAALGLGATAALTSAQAAHAAEIAPVRAAGLVYVGRVQAQTAPSLLPSGGSATLTLDVRNLSKRAISGSVDFWISTPWGARLSALPTARVEDLAPGETRTLTARLDGPGQWTFTTAHAVFTPPAKIDGLGTRPQARQEFLLVPPYFAIASLAVLVLAIAVVRTAVRRDRADRHIADQHGTDQHSAGTLPESAVTA